MPDWEHSCGPASVSVEMKDKAANVRQASKHKVKKSTTAEFQEALLR